MSALAKNELCVVGTGVTGSLGRGSWSIQVAPVPTLTKYANNLFV